MGSVWKYHIFFFPIDKKVLKHHSLQLIFVKAAFVLPGS